MIAEQIPLLKVMTILEIDLFRNLAVNVVNLFLYPNICAYQP